jgi:NTP pyrophosphatase (non-canonical NTP hydrolase)
VIAETVRRSGLVSDYLFAKDWLFAHLNLAGDELAMYERVHAILGEQIPTPDLVIYLQASTDTLMQRIALRDRLYERQMSADYINDLRLAYEGFFADYTVAPLLIIATDEIDFVRNPRDRAGVINRVRETLTGTGLQPSLLDLDAAAGPAPLLQGSHRLPDFQQFHRLLDRRKGFLNDLYLNYICLTEEIGEIGRALRKAWVRQDQLLAQVGNRREAQDRAVEELHEALGEELADALAYLLKIANDAGIDLESAYVQKMGQNWERTWR